MNIKNKTYKSIELSLV